MLDHVNDAPIDLLRRLSDEDRYTLANGLERLSPGDLPRLDALLGRLFSRPGEAAGQRSPLPPPQYDALKKAVRKLLSEAAANCSALREGVLDDIDRSADMLRCLSLDDGREIWRNGYPFVVPDNHGMSRTIPAVAGDCVVSLGPQCQVACWDAASGKARWLIDLVLDYGATVPPWYAGQCPLIDATTDRLILAPGGRALVMAVDYRTGKVIWQSPNPRGWTMTHASIVPMEFAGRRMYVYCGKGGVAGVVGRRRRDPLGHDRLADRHGHLPLAGGRRRRRDILLGRLQRRQPDAAV